MGAEGDVANADDEDFAGEEDGDGDGEEGGDDMTLEDVDADKDGKVSLDEMLEVWARRDNVTNVTALLADLVREKFTEFDADYDKFLNAEEFKKCAEKLDEHSMY